MSSNGSFPVAWSIASGFRAGMGMAALVFLISGELAAQDATKPADGTKPKAEAGAGGEQKSAPAAVAKFSDAANLQNNGAFDLAIEEWTDFLAKFPGDPLAPKAQYYLAVCHVELKQFAKSAALLDTLLKAQDRKSTRLNSSH